MSFHTLRQAPQNIIVRPMPIPKILQSAIATVLFALSIAAAAAQGNTTITVAPRPRVDALEAPWSSLGKLQAAVGGTRATCTAAMIGKRTVLSAAHCLVNGRTKHYFLPSSLHFVAGLTGGKFTAAAVAEEAIADRPTTSTMRPPPAAATGRS